MKIKNPSWKHEFARDFLVLGGIPFYFIATIRAIIGKYSLFVYQMVIGFIILLVIQLILKKLNIKFEIYSARCLVLVVFTSLFYQETLYAVFAFILWIFLLFSALYLKIKKSVIAKGVLAGLVSAAITYFTAPLIG